MSDLPILPRPVRATRLPGEFPLGPDVKIFTSAALAGPARHLAEALSACTGWTLPLQIEEEPPAWPRDSRAIVFSKSSPALAPEAYTADIGWVTTRVVAGGAAGAFYAVQTLLQLLPPAVVQGMPRGNVAWAFPCAQIEDAPRFAWRGLMLDSARWFQPVDAIKRLIRQMAALKLNTFHWHLTDDQSWRLEIKKYPKLTSVGSRRKGSPRGHQNHSLGDDGIPHEGFYSQDDVREIVAFAAAHHVAVVPEIDMPGHAQAAVAAYPEVGCCEQVPEVSTAWGIHKMLFSPGEPALRFLRDVLEEVVELFPGPFVHLGGDEAVKEQWDNSPVAREQMAAQGLAGTEALQGWFLARMADPLAARGRRMLGWDEILDGGVPESGVAMAWRGVEKGVAAAKAGFDVVMAPMEFTYFDFYQSLDSSSEPLAIGGHLPLETVYAFEPVPPALSPEEARRILGVQGQLWTEYLPTPELVEYMAFPRACALAEVAWSAPAGRDYSRFLERLRPHLVRLDLAGIKYRNPWR
jgi:hexosaminidase